MSIETFIPARHNVTRVENAQVITEKKANGMLCGGRGSSYARHDMAWYEEEEGHEKVA